MASRTPNTSRVFIYTFSSVTVQCYALRRTLNREYARKRKGFISACVQLKPVQANEHERTQLRAVPWDVDELKRDSETSIFIDVLHCRQNTMSPVQLSLCNKWNDEIGRDHA